MTRKNWTHEEVRKDLKDIDLFKDERGIWIAVSHDFSINCPVMAQGDSPEKAISAFMHVWDGTYTLTHEHQQETI